MKSLRAFAESIDRYSESRQGSDDLRYLREHGWKWRRNLSRNKYIASRVFGKLEVVKKDKDFHSLRKQAEAFDVLESGGKLKCLTFQVTDDGSVIKAHRRYSAGTWKKAFEDAGWKVTDAGNGKIWVDVPEDYINLQVNLPPRFEQDFVTTSIPAKPKMLERVCLTNDQIARLRELNAQRTQGTWYPHYTDDGSCMNARYVGIRKPERGYCDGKAGMDFYSSDKEPSEDVIAITLLQEPRMADNLRFDENMNFIVEAANSMGALLDELEYWRGTKNV